MASVNAPSYLPPIDRCLRREAVLQSWQHIYEELARTRTGAIDCPRILNDPQAQAVLNSPYQPFSQPSTASKSTCDTLTSAINVTPNSDTSYNIQEVKEDATWLSEKAAIDQVAALRITLLEWQDRHQVYLKEVAQKWQVGANNSIDQDGVLGSTRPGSTDDVQLSQKQRRRKLLELTLSETSYAARCSILLIRVHFLPQISYVDQYGRDSASALNSLQRLGETIATAIYSQSKENGVMSGLDAMKTCISRLERGSGWAEVDDDAQSLEALWLEYLILDLGRATQILYILSRSSVDVFGSRTIMELFNTLAQYDFFMNMQASSEAQMAAITVLQSLAAMLCVAALRIDILAESIKADRRVYAPADAIPGAKAYINDPDCVAQLTDLLIDSAQVSGATTPVAFLWVFVLDLVKEASLLATEKSPENVYGQAWRVIMTGDQSEDPRMTLAAKTVDELRVLDVMLNIGTALGTTFGGRVDDDIEQSVRNTALDVIAAAQGLVQYSPELIALLLYVIGGNRDHWASVELYRSRAWDAVAERFLKDKDLGPAFLIEAKTRFPFEISPFLQMMRVIILRCPNHAETLDMKMALITMADSFTQQLPLKFEHFEQLEAITEDVHENRIRLTYDLPIYVSRRQRQLALPSTDSGSYTSLVRARKQQNSDGDFIPADTLGVIVDDKTTPHVVTWYHGYSLLRYMISSVSTCLPMGDQVEYASRAESSLSNVADIITFFACLVEILPARLDDNAQYQLLLSDLLDDLPTQTLIGRDLVTIVFEIAETQLSALKHQSSSEGSVEVVVSSLQFFNAVASRQPERLWSLLARSQLLGFSGDDGSLNIIASSPIMTGERYEIINACTKLLSTLVTASLEVAASKAPKRQTLSRLALMTADDAAVAVSPQKIKSSILMALSKPLLGVFASGSSYRFSSVAERSALLSDLAVVFDRILSYCYSTGEEAQLQDRIAGVLSETAEFVAKFLLTAPAAATSITYLLSLAYASTGEEAVSNSSSQAATKFATTALRVASLLGQTSLPLVAELLRATPLLAASFACDEASQCNTSLLLGVLMQLSGQVSKQPPSLLGFMGAKVARSFLLSISVSLQSQTSTANSSAIWDMLSAMVSGNQQWFTIYIFTGKPPQERKRGVHFADTANGEALTKPIISHALQQASKPSSATFDQISAILSFIVACQNSWPLAMSHMKKDENAGFIAGITDFVMKLKQDDLADGYKNIMLAGQVAEILSMYLHAARQIGDTTAVNQVAPKLASLRNYGVVPPKYNASLHSRLPANMAKIFPALNLSSLKHTSLATPVYGSNYFYDIELASQLVSRSGKGTDIINDLKLANFNLSAVDAQITLTRRWSTLAVELAKSLNILTDGDRDQLQALLADVVKQCLEYQADRSLSSALPATPAHSLSTIRLELAQTLLQELARSRGSDKHLAGLFSLAWTATREMQDDFIDPFSKGDPVLYRSLLRILFLTIQPLTRKPSNPQVLGPTHNTLRMSVMNVSKTAPKAQQAQSFAEAADLLQVLDDVVAKGFRALATLVHDDQSLCNPSNFVLLTAILQSILNVPNIESLHSQIAVQFGNATTSRYAMSLFSWAHQLATQTNNDPIYGELSILFLLELSSVPAMAEQLAVEGILSQLSSASLMHYFERPSGMGPFDAPQRMHSIWARGILPLCLNLIDAVGAPVAAEVSAFLNQYPYQLARAVTSLTNTPILISTSSRQPDQNSGITLSHASEVHSLSLVSLLLDRYRVAGSSTGSLGTGEISALQWDKATVKEELDDWLGPSGGLTNLVDRIAAGNEVEGEMGGRRALGKGGVVRTRLEERVVEELRRGRACLGVEVEGV